MANVRVQLDDRAVVALLSSESGPVAADLLAKGKMVEGAAKRRTPVDTGRLRSSISTGLFKLAGEPYLSCRVGTDVDYAAFVHDGTRYMRGRPFLDDALREIFG